MNELDLFAAAIAIANAGERAALLDRECAGRCVPYGMRAAFGRGIGRGIRLLV